MTSRRNGYNVYNDRRKNLFSLWQPRDGGNSTHPNATNSKIKQNDGYIGLLVCLTLSTILSLSLFLVPLGWFS